MYDQIQDEILINHAGYLIMADCATKKSIPITVLAII